MIVVIIVVMIVVIIVVMIVVIIVVMIVVIIVVMIVTARSLIFATKCIDLQLIGILRICQRTGEYGQQHEHRNQQRRQFPQRILHGSSPLIMSDGLIPPLRTLPQRSRAGAKPDGWSAR